MLTILPEQDKQKSGERLNTAYAASGYEKESGKDPALLVVREGGKELGYIAVDVDKTSVRILDFQLYGCTDYRDMDVDQSEYCEMMIRSAASYALNRNLFHMETKLVSIFPLVKRYGFRKDDERMGMEKTAKIVKVLSNIPCYLTEFIL